jgi:apolipoprotein N-acyltransferase
VARIGENCRVGPPGREEASVRGTGSTVDDPAAGDRRPAPAPVTGSAAPAGPDPIRGVPLPWAAVLALGSGFALLGAFPPYGLWWLAPVAVAMFALAVAGRRPRTGALLGLLHGAAFFVPLLHWTGIYVGAFPWLLLAASQTAFLAALGAVHPWAWRRPALLPLLTAALWVAQEALRSRLPFGGFPWGRLAFSQGDAPTLRLASLGGAPLVTFGVAFAGGLLALALVRAAARPRRLTGPGLAAAGAVAVVLLGAAVPLPEPSGRAVTVAVVQGNVPRLGLDFNAQRRAVLDNHVRATLDLARRVEAGTTPRPDLVVWPENSSDIDPLRAADARAEIDRAARAVGVPILVGAVLEGPGDKLRNAGIVWDPATGPGELYVKQHPVPFAEYVPFRAFARRISDQVDLVRRDFAAGGRPGVLRVGPATVGDVICFEVAYDGLVRSTVTGGAGLLVVQTNNATFGMSAESAQQLAMVKLRAVEHGRPAVMASTTGISATVTHAGRVTADTELFTRDVLVRTLRLGETSTVSTSTGSAAEYLACGIAVAGLLAAAARRPRRPLETRGRSAAEGDHA